MHCMAISFTKSDMDGTAATARSHALPARPDATDDADSSPWDVASAPQASFLD